MEPTSSDTSSRPEAEEASVAAKTEKKESWWDVVRFALITLAVIIPIRLYIAQPFIVSGSSMDPTFHNGEYLIVDELSYRFEAPQRGDVIIFRFPQDPSKYFIKRIIGLPGETVKVQGGRVYVTPAGGKQFELQEPYLSQKTYKDASATLQDGQFFVMGDNRSVSYDSRYWGPLDKSYIRGRALVRLFPPTKLSALPGEFHDYGSSTEPKTN